MCVTSSKASTMREVRLLFSTICLNMGLSPEKDQDQGEDIKDQDDVGDGVNPGLAGQLGERARHL